MEARSPLQPGDTFAGKYTVERVLGQGGMGVVIGAVHRHTRDRVALKFLLPEAAENAEVRARFFNEARAAVQIKSEHVARITDVDSTPDGTPYMVMEYLEGRDLSALLGDQGPLSVEKAVDYLLQACEALAEAHVLGIVHRDLKPGNLFLTHRRDGSELVKVLDFGISKIDTGGDARLTRTRGVMGSPLYMSPEQLTNPKGVDARSDVWALGVVLYELLTKSWPFEHATMEGLVVQIVTAEPRSVRQQRPDLPDTIESIVSRCLEKDPGDRFATVAALAAALAPLGSSQAARSATRISKVVEGAITHAATVHAQAGAAGSGAPVRSLTGAASTPALAAPAAANEVAMETHAPLVAPATSGVGAALAVPVERSVRPLWIAGAGGLLLIGVGLVAIAGRASNPTPEDRMRSTALAPSSVVATSNETTAAADATPTPTPLGLVVPSAGTQPTPVATPAPSASTVSPAAAPPATVATGRVPRDMSRDRSRENGLAPPTPTTAPVAPVGPHPTAASPATATSPYGGM